MTTKTWTIIAIPKRGTLIAYCISYKKTWKFSRQPQLRTTALYESAKAWEPLICARAEFTRQKEMQDAELGKAQKTGTLPRQRCREVRQPGNGLDVVGGGRSLRERHKRRCLLSDFRPSRKISAELFHWFIRKLWNFFFFNIRLNHSWFVVYEMFWLFCDWIYLFLILFNRGF